ncbi:MAG TPA: DUF4416 family protein [Candidatus Eremiobacteraeota bacterium]|nr:MAG: hypothetical protein BWY64_01027 [bacterium ADurb.Bin363]HPZ08780.1 DUF4416 family protein [Candidatus Eremiobacteraeota bacterium]
MSEISAVEPVKLFLGILFNSEKFPLKIEIEKLFGKIDYISPVFPFNLTDYYRDEMGDNLSRLFYSFENLILPHTIADIKLSTNELEKKFSFNGKRHINLDPGYLDYHKIVLASAKFGGQKIYIGKGMYADMTLWYKKGHFKPFPWTFLDFKDGLYDKVFLEIRQRYKFQRKNKKIKGENY